MMSSETCHGVLSAVPPTPTFNCTPSVMPFRTADWMRWLAVAPSASPAATRASAFDQTMYAPQSEPAGFGCVASTLPPLAEKK